MTYSYQAETFANARRALMLPHSGGESESIANAFHECMLGLHRLPQERLSEDARKWVSELEKFMDTAGVIDPDKRGAWLVKAEQFSLDDQIEISRLVDDLASWFDSSGDGQ